jgi:hypothetical protein
MKQKDTTNDNKKQAKEKTAQKKRKVQQKKNAVVSKKMMEGVPRMFFRSFSKLKTNNLQHPAAEKRSFINRHN